MAAKLMSAMGVGSAHAGPDEIEIRPTQVDFAQGLPTNLSVGHFVPYLTFHINDSIATRVHTAKVKDWSRGLTFNESHKLYCDTSRDFLHIQLWDDNTLRKDTLVAENKIPLMELKSMQAPGGGFSFDRKIDLLPPQSSQSTYGLAGGFASGTMGLASVHLNVRLLPTLRNTVGGAHAADHTTGHTAAAAGTGGVLGALTGHHHHDHQTTTTSHSATTKTDMTTSPTHRGLAKDNVLLTAGQQSHIPINTQAGIPGMQGGVMTQPGLQDTMMMNQGGTAVPMGMGMAGQQMPMGTGMMGQQAGGLNSQPAIPMSHIDGKLGTNGNIHGIGSTMDKDAQRTVDPSLTSAHPMAHPTTGATTGMNPNTTNPAVRF